MFNKGLCAYNIGTPSGPGTVGVESNRKGIWYGLWFIGGSTIRMALAVLGTLSMCVWIMTVWGKEGRRVAEGG